MARLLLDSTVLVDVSRGHNDAIDFVDFERQAGHEVMFSVVTAMELIVGCRNKREVEEVQKLIAGFTVLEIMPPISRKAYELLVEFNKSHGLQIPDALIAATALVEGVTLTTANTRHFSMIEGLSLRQPY